MSREIRITTPEHVELVFELAGLGSRFIALLVDTLIQTLGIIVLGLIYLAVVKFFSLAGIQSLSPWILAILILAIFLLISGYFLYFEVKSNGQTPGKRMVGIRVIRDSGHPVDFRSALLRNMMRIVDMLPSTYAVGFIAVFFSPQHRRLGDTVAGTLVIKTYAAKETAEKSVSDQGAALASNEPEISNQADDSSCHTLILGAKQYLDRLTRDDYQAIRHFLNRKDELDPAVLNAMADKMLSPIAGKLQINVEEISSPLAFLEAAAAEWERRMVH